ncbi:MULTISPECIES: DUF6760 family protein [unclassified Sphingomonas]|uniref:DUF6760 family protein n=1 Tax=unclassified Sphingomonas TaxID=196159 RepID=UPI002AA2B624|nr:MULTISPECIES: DUF6760 family protein [unclassified Sphingomonas]
MRQRVQGQSGSVAFFSSGVNLEGLRRELFFLAYHLHWSWSEIMSMPTDERQAFAALLREQIERENAEINAARRG